MKTSSFKPVGVGTAMWQWLIPVLLICFSLCFAVASMAPNDNNGTLKVKVRYNFDSTNIAFASVAVIKSGKPVAAATTNEVGESRFSLKPGIYDIKVVFIGYESKQVDGIKVQLSKTTCLDVTLEATRGNSLEEMVTLD